MASATSLRARNVPQMYMICTHHTPGQRVLEKNRGYIDSVKAVTAAFARKRNCEPEHDSARWPEVLARVFAGTAVDWIGDETDKKSSHKYLCLDFRVARLVHRMDDPIRAWALKLSSWCDIAALKDSPPPNAIVVEPGPSCEPGGAGLVTVRPMTAGETLLLYGDPQRQMEYVFVCRCGQTPCEQRVPKDWAARRPDRQRTRGPHRDQITKSKKPSKNKEMQS